MHTKEMSESDGEFDAEKQSKRPCPQCKAEGTVYYRVWESSCGGYEDEKYTCRACGKTWWVEGPDA